MECLRPPPLIRGPFWWTEHLEYLGWRRGGVDLLAGKHCYTKPCALGTPNPNLTYSLSNLKREFCRQDYAFCKGSFSHRETGQLESTVSNQELAHK